MPVQLPPEPLEPFMRFLDRHYLENIDNASGQNIKERSVRMRDMHPAVAVLQQFHIRRSIRIFEFQEMLLDNPAIFLRQAVNVLQRPLLDVYSHDASLFSGPRIQDRCQAEQNLLPLRSCPDGR